MTRLEDQIEALTQQFQEFLANQNQQNHNPYDSGDDSAGSDDFWQVPQQRCRVPIHFEGDRRQDEMRLWEARMRTEVPEFHGSLQPEEFLDWLCY